MASRSLAPRVGVAALFLVSIVVQVRFTYDSMDTNLHVTERGRPPFNLQEPEGTLAAPKPEAVDAGLAVGDRPVRMDGQLIGGNGDVFEVVQRHRGGDRIEISVTRDGAPVFASLKVHPASDQPLSIRDWILTSILTYLTPWFCMLLGFGVAFLRPRDLLAWLLLLLMLSFSQIAQGDAFVAMVRGWHGWARAVAISYHALLNGSWALWMMLFGQYFPTRQSDKWWDRVARWMLGLPIAIVTLTSAVVDPQVVGNASAMAGVQHVLRRLAPILLATMMSAIGLFFADIFMKMEYATARDDRRRLKLLYTGASVSLTPLFLLILASLIMGKSLTNVAEWLIVPALLLLFVFPSTLAYVIVVERAMELQVVVRQGLQYALARRGLRVLMTLLITALLAFALRIITDPAVRRPQQIATLAVAVVIVLSMRRVAELLRGWIDRRFFREAVNAERVLTDLSEKVRTILEIGPLLQTVTETISSALHVPRVAVLVRQNGDYMPVQTLGYDSPGPQMKFSTTSAVAERLAKGEQLRISRTRPEPWIDQNVRALDSELLLPLSVKDRLLGVLSVGPKLSEEPYSPTDVQLLRSVAAQTGLALENTRLTEAVASEVAQRERINRELEIAREVQQRLFPQSGPVVAGLDYAGKCRPASSVGGDYYDFVAMCDGRLGIAIGDISGKGVPAALLMASLQASLRGLAIANPPALATLMVNLNQLIYDASPSNRYATFFYGVYNPQSGEFLYVNGGHNPPMVFRGNEVLRLEEGGPVVGLFGPAQYQQGSVVLAPGDTMVLFTDGVSEAMNAADEEFDEDRLMLAVRGNAILRAPELIDAIMRACDDFVAGAPQHDDMTLVVVRVE